KHGDAAGVVAGTLLWRVATVWVRGRGRPPAFPLEIRVDRTRRAVQEQPRRTEVAAGLLHADVDAFDEMMWRRERLAEGELASAFVEHRDVGEGPPDVGSKPQVRARLGSAR